MQLCRKQKNVKIIIFQLAYIFHNLHIPLKELSPDTKCNWEPKTVFLCVGDNATDPSKCNSLFAIGTKQDDNDIIIIECEISNWCIRTAFGLYTESINKLNRDYVVNIVVRMPNKPFKQDK